METLLTDDGLLPETKALSAVINRGLHLQDISRVMVRKERLRDRERKREAQTDR